MNEVTTADRRMEIISKIREDNVKNDFTTKPPKCSLRFLVAVILLSFCILLDLTGKEICGISNDKIYYLLEKDYEYHVWNELLSKLSETKISDLFKIGDFK